MREKSHVEDINRSIYDVKDTNTTGYHVDEGLTEKIV